MDIQLQFIRSCVRRDISTDDIGYLTRWCFIKSSLEEFKELVASSIEDKFFDNNTTIKNIYNSYFNTGNSKSEVQ